MQGTAASDAEIQRNVRDSLSADCRIASENINVRVARGKVYLQGTVPDVRQMDLAATVANRLKGVRGVVNQLSVVIEESRTDTDITADVVAALAADPHVDEEKVDVTTADGVVYLHGTVTSYGERRAAFEAAHSVEGALDVINDLVVVARYARADEEIEADVERQLGENLKLDHARIDVEVRHGVVRLRGSVATVEQRWLVDEVVRWTPGVIDVINDLRVVPFRAA